MNRDPRAAHSAQKVQIPQVECRVGCGACCIAPSISSPIPGMPGGKPAGVRCVQLSDDNRCLLYGDPRRPQACVRFRPSPEVCGSSQAEALRLLAEMELASAPQGKGATCAPTG